MKNIFKIIVFNLLYYSVLIAIQPPVWIFVVLLLVGYLIGWRILDRDDGRYTIPNWEVVTAGFVWLLGPGLPVALDHFLLGGYLKWTLWF